MEHTYHPVLIYTTATKCFFSFFLAAFGTRHCGNTFSPVFGLVLRCSTPDLSTGRCQLSARTGPQATREDFNYIQVYKSPQSVFVHTLVPRKVFEKIVSFTTQKWRTVWTKIEIVVFSFTFSTLTLLLRPPPPHTHTHTHTHTRTHTTVFFFFFLKFLYGVLLCTNPSESPSSHRHTSTVSEPS